MATAAAPSSITTCFAIPSRLVSTRLSILAPTSSSTDLTPSTLRTGYLNFLKYYHNTLIGEAPRGDVNAGDYTVESNYNNNLQIAADNITSIGVNCRGNHNYKPSDFVDFEGRDLRLAAGSGAIDVGIVLPGINDGYSGAAPDAGALEYGQRMWKVGHDFSDPPNPEFGWVPLPGTNLFGDGQFSQPPTGWIETGTPVWFSGNAWNTGGTGLSRIGGRCIQLNPGDGIRRIFTQLKPNTWYTVASETRLVDQRIDAEQFGDSQGEIASASHRGEDYVSGLAEGDWLRYDNIDFGAAGKYDLLELTYTRPPGTTPGSDAATLEVRSGSPTGQLLGEFEYNPNVIDSWYASRIHIPALSGKHSIYLLGKGEGAATLRLATLRLLNTNIPPDNKLTIRVRNSGVSDVTTRVGEAFWRLGYESFTFRTGPGATSAELFIQNDGLYDAYLDRFALYEKEPLAVDAAATGTPVQSSAVPGSNAAMTIDGDDSSVAVTDDAAGNWWQVDLGGHRNLYGIKLTAPTSQPSLLSNFRLSVWDTEPHNGDHALWQCDYLTNSALSAGETLIIKATERATDGVTELQDTHGRFVRVESLGTGALGLAEVEVLIYDENDLVESDGIVRRDTGLWQVTFAQIINIGALTLLNVDDASYGELSNFQVSVWDRDPGDGGRVLWQRDCFPTGSVDRAGRFAIRCDEIDADGVTRLGSVLGRTVRVQINGRNNVGNGRLSLADATVYNMTVAPPVSNIAPSGKVTQSSNLYVNSGLAQVAINNIILPRGDFTSTRPETNAWWQMGLKQISRIEQIVLFNRTDAAARIGNFQVSVWDGPPQNGGSELWARDYSYAKGDLPAGGSLTINGSTRSDSQRLDEVRDARFVRVQLLGRNILSLAEVQVWGASRMAQDVCDM